MTNSDERDAVQGRDTGHRLEFIKRWAAYVRTHDDAEWSRQQNTVIDSQLQSANELAASGQTDPIEFFKRRDRRREQSRVHRE